VFLSIARYWDYRPSMRFQENARVKARIRLICAAHGFS